VATGAARADETVMEPPARAVGSARGRVDYDGNN
jgi:hypothetical protein